MTPRKVVAVSSDVDNLYAVADDGTMWFQLGNGWGQMPPLPPREDEGEGLLSSNVLRQTEEELRIAHNAIAQLGAKNERIRSDLLRVREAVRDYVDSETHLGQLDTADVELVAINKEPMP